MTNNSKRGRLLAVGLVATAVLMVTLTGCERHEVSSTPKPSAAEVGKMPTADERLSAEATPAPGPVVTPGVAAETTSAAETSNVQ